MISSTMMPDATPANTDRRKEYADNMYTPFLLPEDTEKHTIFILTLIKKKKSTRVFMILVDFLLDEI